MTAEAAAALHAEIARCTVCAGTFPHDPRPVVRFSPTCRVLIIGQAPGARVHESGIPWNDPSGARLRQWTGLTPDLFYDDTKIALVPMGFCYPGTGSAGDLPPRPECAPLWHDRVLAQLPDRRLTLLVGTYAQARYLPSVKKPSLTERVRAFERFRPEFIPLPHPSWRSTGWLKQNPWFETDLLPVLKAEVARVLS